MGNPNMNLEKQIDRRKIFFEGSPTNHYIKVRERSSAVIFAFFSIFQMLLKSRIFILGQHMIPYFKDLNL